MLTLMAGDRYEISKSWFRNFIALLFAVASMSQDKGPDGQRQSEGEQGSPSGVSVILLQDDREITAWRPTREASLLWLISVPACTTVTFRKPGLAVGSIPNLDLKGGQKRVLHDLVLG